LSFTRREFLRRAFLVATVLLARASARAAAKRADADSWALLADTHIPADRTRVIRDVNMVDHFQRVRTEVLALPKRPAGLFIAGDCAVSSGEPGDYAMLAELLQPLRAARIPVHLALGNHDHRENFRAAFPEHRVATRALPERHVAVIESARANWFMLDSLDQTLVTPGWLGEAQRAWLARTLDARKAKPAIVVLHHDLDPKRPNSRLRDTDEFLAILRPRRHVKACVFGHSHVWEYTRDFSGLHLVNLPPVAYVFRAGEPSGWVHATLEQGGARLELRCVDTQHPAQGQVLRLEWR